MSDVWQLQDAKNRFSELVQRAIVGGPQKVTRHGHTAIVILSLQDYKKLVQPKGTLFKFLRKSPLKGVPLDLRRNKQRPRMISL